MSGESIIGGPGDGGLVPADDFWKAQHEARQRDLEEREAAAASGESDGDGWFVFRDSAVDLREPSSAHVIKRLLVANRGEIARRVFRTASRMNIETVAIFSEPDRNAAHVRDADIAVALGGVTSAESYLDVTKILDAARRSGADAIHPGYGFLSENPDFAEAVIGAGLIWVGPAPESIRAMALKVEAKRIAESAGIPLVPGAEMAPDASDEELLAVAEGVGFPLLVKASAGGGGKGMRTVRSAGDLTGAVAGARREAQSSFGDPTVFFERYLIGARHVEVQIFGDTHGNVVHFFERECSIQRRHQKIVEESPSPGTTAAVLHSMFFSAVSLAKSIDYVGAGTIEFLVAGSGKSQEFFFLEMNTRLQVEHPVTECIVRGLDLVRWQLLVAQGFRLATSQDEIERHGHAIEVRLYAEDPGRGYLPSTGTAVAFQTNAQYEDSGRHGRNIRDELGIEAGDEVSSFYDPMIGKIIGYGGNRRSTALKLAANLRSRDIAGIATNRDSLVAILESEAFLAGDTSTDFLELNPELQTPRIDPDIRERHLIAASIAHAVSDRQDSRWGTLAPIGWRNIMAIPQSTVWQFNEAGASTTSAVVIDWRDDHSGVAAIAADVRKARLTGQVGGRSFEFAIATEDGSGGQPCDFSVSLRLQIDGVSRKIRIASQGEWAWVNDGDTSSSYRRLPRFDDAKADAHRGGPSAPVPGTVVAVEVSVGDPVVAGRTLVILEAMKMEHKITSSFAGVVSEVLVAAGDSVDAHQMLVVVTPGEVSI